MTVGEKNPKKKNKTILLVGETGAGKSTLINTLFNYSMGVKWEDQIWFQIVQEEEKSQGKSQTSDVIVYEIFDFEDKILPYSLTIVDTPGYGDTRGFKCDDIIRERLLDLFRSDDGVHEVHVVGVVMKASDNRLSDRLMYSFDSVMSLFGNDMEKNIVALITHSNALKQKSAINILKAGKIKCAKNEKDNPVYFLFDNCQDAGQTEEEDEEEEEEEEEVLEALWCADKISTKGMTKFTEFLGKTESQKLKTTAQVLDERIRLTACIQNLQERINLTELKQSEIRQIQEALQEHEEEMKKNKEFTVEIDEVYKEKQNIKSGTKWLVFYEGAVCCTVCEENCHYPGCTKAWKPQHCEVMRGGRCTVCTEKCPASDHVKGNWIYAIKTRRVQKTIEDIKEKYGKHKSESENRLSLLENLEKELNQLTTEKSKLLDESYQHIVTLEHLALKVDTWSTIVHLDLLIEKLKEKGDTEKVQKLEAMRSRVDEGTRAALRYRQVQVPMSR
ncbi:septin-5-like [Haplochromis burtoni]|uniref:septin-5-like n=1 Tax=Haplochromis burtoni TaxID=8153 RepID=UPI001C2DE213|nr:septin-5-like [Haplochromis burtoni]